MAIDPKDSRLLEGGRGCEQVIPGYPQSPTWITDKAFERVAQVAFDSLDVRLPEAASGESRPVSLLAVVVDQRGKIFLNGKPSSEQGIRSFIPTFRSSALFASFLV